MTDVDNEEIMEGPKVRRPQSHCSEHGLQEERERGSE